MTACRQRCGGIGRRPGLRQCSAGGAQVPRRGSIDATAGRASGQQCHGLIQRSNQSEWRAGPLWHDLRRCNSGSRGLSALQVSSVCCTASSLLAGRVPFQRSWNMRQKCNQHAHTAQQLRQVVTNTVCRQPAADIPGWAAELRPRRRVPAARGAGGAGGGADGGRSHDGPHDGGP